MQTEPEPGARKRRTRRVVGRILGGAVAVCLANWALASWMVIGLIDDLVDTAQGHAWNLAGPQLDIAVRRLKGGEEKAAPFLRLSVQREADEVRLYAEHEDYAGLITAGRSAGVWFPKTGAFFDGGPSDLPATRKALNAAVGPLAELTVVRRLALALYLHPFIVGCERAEGERAWRIALRRGSARARLNGSVRSVEASHPAGDATWQIGLRIERARSDLPIAAPTGRTAARIPAEELDRSLAAIVDLLALSRLPVAPESDTVRHEGEGRLAVRGGHRYLFLKGDAHAVGYQHGRLLGPHVARLVARIVYGVGFYYSMEKGRWFLADARALVERQRPHIDPDHFEEMRGLAEGSGVPLDLVQVANLFPEFFHCSGAALFGRATRDGKLLHVRVLDYMTEVGLQDEAVVIATEKTGARRFVNVSYAGFVGSVSGMNEDRVAIGEMGGRGEGQWDGTPMSLLVRGALERCGTLEEVLTYFRDHKRTCEYYYVVSDGKTRSAAGVKATPAILDVVRPGEGHPELPSAVEDAVLLSAGSRYEALVKRVRDAYGRIDADALIAIVDRPVSMKSNLHNVIFVPEDLELRVAHAGRHTPACSGPYVPCRWEDLFNTPASTRP